MSVSSWLTLPVKIDRQIRHLDIIGPVYTLIRRITGLVYIITIPVTLSG